MAAIGVNWADIWGPVWGPVWAQVASSPDPTHSGSTGRRRRRRAVAVWAAKRKGR